MWPLKFQTLYFAQIKRWPPHFSIPSPTPTAFCPSESDSISSGPLVTVRESPCKLAGALKLQGCSGQSVPRRCHTPPGSKCWSFEVGHSEATSASEILSLAFLGLACCSPEESKLLLLLSPAAFYTKLISLIIPPLIFTRFRRSSIPWS